MKRQPVATYEAAAYPQACDLPDRRSFLRTLGTATGAVAVVVASPGCFMPGDVAVPYEGDEYLCLLPEGPRGHSLDFHEGGFVDYRIEALVNDAALADFLLGDPEDLLLLVDEFLAAGSIRALAPGRDLSRIEEIITHILADEWFGYEGAPTDNFLHLFVEVLTYDEGESIDGDIESVG